MSGGDRAVLRAKSVMARNDITGAPSSGGSVAMYYEEPDDEEPWRDPEDDEWAEDFRSELTPHDYDDSYIEQFAKVAETVLEP